MLWWKSRYNEVCGITERAYLPFYSAKWMLVDSREEVTRMPMHVTHFGTWSPVFAETIFFSAGSIPGTTHPSQLTPSSVLMV